MQVLSPAFHHNPYKIASQRPTKQLQFGCITGLMCMFALENSNTAHRVGRGLWRLNENLASMQDRYSCSGKSGKTETPPKAKGSKQDSDDVEEPIRTVNGAKKSKKETATLPNQPEPPHTKQRISFSGKNPFILSAM